MIVCVCKRISEREILGHARLGMDFEDIQFELGVATQCGKCEECARDVVAQCQKTGCDPAMRGGESPIILYGRHHAPSQHAAIAAA